MVAFILPILTLALSHLSAAASCYYANGTDVTEYSPASIAYQPCNASAEASMCCRINLPVESARDHCRADGLCDSPKYQYLWRESCTDPTWESPRCQKLCLNYEGKDPFGNIVAGVNSIITQCDDGSYCCGFDTNGTTCCNEGKGVWLVNGKETSVNPNATASSSTFTSSSSSPTALPGTDPSNIANPSAPSTSPTSAPSKRNDTGAIAGGVVGGVLGLALIAGVLWWLLKHRQVGGEGSSMPKGDGRQEIGNGNEKRYPQELSGGGIVFEADGLPRGELDGGVR